MMDQRNVDICVTCVSEKPPQLPLREELPSLGIEVVYNAQGVGAKACRREQKLKLKEYQEAKLNFFSKLVQDKEKEERKEAELREPHAISYTSYQKRLRQQKEPDGCKTGDMMMKNLFPGGESAGLPSSIDTTESSLGDNGPDFDRYATPLSPSKRSHPPIKSLEIPHETPEDQALKAAFNVFSEVESEVQEDRNQVESPRRDAYSSQNQSTSSRYTQSTSTESHLEQSSGPTSTRPSIPSQIHHEKMTSDNHEHQLSHPKQNGSSGQADTYSVESLQAMAAAFLSKPSPRIPDVEFYTTTNKASIEGREYDDRRESVPFEVKKSPASIRVSRINHDDKVAEHYDLTALSSEDSHREEPIEDPITPVIHRPSIKTRDPAIEQSHLSPRSQERSESRLRFRVPEYTEDGDGFVNYGRIVLDLSNIEEQDGPGSPLVLSPRTSPGRHRSIEGRQDSPTRRIREDPFAAFAAGAEKHLSLLRGSRSRAMFDDTTTIHPDPSILSHSTFETLDARRLSSYADHFLPPASPRRRGYEQNKEKDIRKYQEGFDTFQHDAPHEASPLSQSLKQSFSREDRDVRPNLSVSFSQDVEARYHTDEQIDTRLEDITDLVDEVDGGFLSIARPNPSLIRPRGGIQDTRQPKEKLISALLGEGPIPSNAAHFISRNKKFVKEQIPGTNLYPLHAACMLDFPNRFVGGRPCLVRDLVHDISERKQLLLAFLQADPNCCTYLDDGNDFPVHIISRKLMEWEAMWYQKVYERAREDGSVQPGGGTGITTLYQTMSHTVDILLKPLAAKEELCQQPGGSGYLLPLHIAAIFTVNFNTLKAVIEQYPAAAQQKCSLTGVRTFIPDFSTPLELHCRLSTDFPKWEIEQNFQQEMDIQWTQSTLDHSYGTVDGIRRSDLMFAFHPDITPYRHEAQRIRRLETRIRTEIERAEADPEASHELSLPIKLVWEWMCTYKGDSDDDHYADSVHRIVASLSAHAVKMLAATPSKYGRAIMDSALDVCAVAIENRLAEIKRNLVPVPMDTLSSTSRQRCFFLREWEERAAEEYCLRGRGFIGVLCRTLFNIHEVSFPTSFVLLPYQLVKDEEGRLGLESAEAAAIAMKFADTLLQLTDPQKVLHFLEKKVMRYHSTSLGVESSPEWDRVEAKTRKDVSQMLSLYASGKAYLYFIDEYSGVPIVPDDHEQSAYPLVISDAMDTVRRVLPLMMSGMILMRGEKALSVIANVLLNGNISMVQEHWLSAAKDLLGYLYSPQTEWTTSFLNDLRPLRAPLVELIQAGPSDDAPVLSAEGLASEWVVELSLVKMLVEMYDASHSLSGLRPRRADQQVLWTRDAAFLGTSKELFQMDFKSLESLKEVSEELEEKGLTKIKGNTDSSSDDEEEFNFEKDSSVDFYGLLFREFAYSLPSQERERSEQNPDDIACFVAEPPPIARKRWRPLFPSPAPLIKFDEYYGDADLDDVLKLRILLAEQEAKLEYLHDRMLDAQLAGMELLEEEDRLTDLMDDSHRQTDRLEDAPSPGLTMARKLLLRICDLEDRVRFNQVQVGQLNNEVTCFQLESAQSKV